MLMLVATVTNAERVKDLASIEGMRGNPLVGYGIVVGLDGSGDQTSQTPFTVQSMKSMLARLGVSIPPNVNPQLKNVAAVTIHGELPPLAKTGQKIDITVSSIGNAKSLRGGSLLMSTLKGIDGQVYAVAQGNVIVSGFGVSGRDGSRIAVNVPSTGRIPNGATVERVLPVSMENPDGSIVLNLHTPSFTTVDRLTKVIIDNLGIESATPIDGSSIRVSLPKEPRTRMELLALLENLEVEPGLGAARVIVNARTGTVIIGRHVKVSAAAVTHGSLSVTIRERARVSQPAPLSKGETAIIPESEIIVSEADSRMFLFDPGVSLGDLVRAVNRVGAAPGDLVAILEALKQAGALHAELVVI